MCLTVATLPFPRGLSETNEEIDRMTRTQLFPALLIALDLGAAVVYALEPDVRRAIYGLAAAVLTTVVTF